MDQFIKSFLVSSLKERNESTGSEVQVIASINNRNARKFNCINSTRKKQKKSAKINANKVTKAHVDNYMVHLLQKS